MYATDLTVDTALEALHYQHLLDEGFTPDEISELEMYGAVSITQNQALIKGIKKWDETRHIHLTDGGLYFPFHSEYGQIRLNKPVQVDGKTFKYLGPAKPPKEWKPKPKIHARTEGWKDAAMPTVRGIATGAIVGVDNIIYCTKKGDEIPIIFDSDGWKKPQVVRALVIGAIWTNGKINLFPEMPEYPTGGACEFFKSGYSISDYQDLIDSAMSPIEFIQAWISRWDDFDDLLKIECARVAAKAVRVIQAGNRYLDCLDDKVADKKNEWIDRLN